MNKLQYLTGTTLLVETKQPMPELDKLKGVRGIEERDGSLSFQMDHNELGNVIRYVSGSGIALEISILLSKSSNPMLNMGFFIGGKRALKPLGIAT